MNGRELAITRHPAGHDVWPVVGGAWYVFNVVIERAEVESRKYYLEYFVTPERRLHCEGVEDKE